MSDPSIQTFCCHRPGVSNPSITIMSVFNSPHYNTVCLISSIFGCLGAGYQLLPRAETQISRRWFSLTSFRGRQIVVWLALADLMASIGVFMRSVVKLNNPIEFWEEEEIGEIIYCIIIASWIQYFYVVTWIWTLIYAVDTWLALNGKPGWPKVYHTLAWALPIVLTSVGLAMLYLPDADCNNYSMKQANTSEVFKRLLPNYLTTYAVICAVMIICPIFFILSAKRVDDLVVNCLCQVTNKERAVVQAIKFRFGLINLTFYVCWLPNLINGIVVWTSWYNLPKTLVLTIWYIMAVLNPLQAFFNSIVYRRSNMKLISPFKSEETTPIARSFRNYQVLN